MKRLVTNTVPILGIALVWRFAHWLSPTIYMTVVGIILFVGLAILYVKQPILRQTLKWAWLILLGAGLNFAAIIGNGGMMPYPHIMSNAWWVWLGDWLPMGVFSPGDILMIVGFLGVAITLIHNVGGQYGKRSMAWSLQPFQEGTTSPIPIQGKPTWESPSV